MKRIICIRFVALFVLLTMILSACSDKNKTEDTDSENKPEENRYINCAPQYGNPSVKPTSPSGTKTSAWTWEDYLKAKEESGFTDLDNWLSWEQFSALGEFHKSFWWDGSPESSQYEYLYTDEITGKSWIYHVTFDKIPEDSGVTNFKEYWQWYFGSEWDSTEEYVGHWNRRMIVNTPSISPDAFPDSDLTNIDPNDPIFANCKSQYGGFNYYVDGILELGYSKYSNSVSNPEFFYDGWFIKIIKKTVEEDDFNCALDNTDPEILQKLVNANTYKEAIEELMNPANGNYDK